MGESHLNFHLDSHSSLCALRLSIETVCNEEVSVIKIPLEIAKLRGQHFSSFCSLDFLKFSFFFRIFLIVVFRMFFLQGKIIALKVKAFQQSHKLTRMDLQIIIPVKR